MIDRAQRLAALTAYQRPGATLPRPTQTTGRMRVEALAGARTADVYLYGVIGWDVWAEELVPELAALDVDELICHVNSPGGDCFDGIALANTLAAHPAKVTMHIEGMAASAASVIAMAGDDIVMHPGARIMIHDALCLCVGNAADHQSAAALLDAVSQDIAGIYASRAGGDVAEWRQRMLAETWLSADEAVTSGLADRVVTRDQPTEEDGTGDALAPAAHAWSELVAQWRDDALATADARAGAVTHCADPRPETGAAPLQPTAVDHPLPADAGIETSVDAPTSPAAVPAPEPQTAAVSLSELLCSAIREGVTL